MDSYSLKKKTSKNQLKEYFYNFFSIMWWLSEDVGFLYEGIS